MPGNSLLAASVLFGFLALPAYSSARLPLVERAMSDTATHPAGIKQDSLGDLLAFANPVYDATNSHQLGRDQGFCIRVELGKSWERFWTLILKDGQITLEGPFHDHGDSVMVVTGGSGQYNGAKGSMTLHVRDSNGSSYDFD